MSRAAHEVNHRCDWGGRTTRIGTGTTARPCNLLGAEDEGVAINVFECGGGAPVFTFRLHDELHAFTLQLARGGFDVVRPESDVHLAAGLETLAEFEKDDARLRAGDAELDPTLLLAERLVGDQAKAELFGVEREGAILIGDGDASEFDAFDHC